MSIRTQLSCRVYQNFSNEFIQLNIDLILLLILSFRVLTMYVQDYIRAVRAPICATSFLLHAT